MENPSSSTTTVEQSKIELTISENATAFLSETSKWSRLLAIIGFIFVGFMVIISLLISTVWSSFPGREFDQGPNNMGVLFGMIYLLMSFLYFVPTYYLFKFAQKLKIAIVTKNNSELDQAFSNQKSLYKFWGIFILVIMGIYILIGLIAFVIFLLK